MKFRYLIILYLLAFSVCVNGQVAVNVVDAELNIPLSGVSFISEEKDTFYSDKTGFVRLGNIGQFLIQKQGYLDNEIVIDSKKDFRLQLDPISYAVEALNIVSFSDAKPLNNIPSALSKVDRSSIASLSELNLDQAINTVPGVYMQSGVINTNRITIRGIGSRNLFGTAKIRAYLGDIPLTDGSGASDIGDIEIQNIENVDVLKGSHPIYGAGLGGIILMNPAKPKFNTSFLEASQTTGSFGLSKQWIKFNHDFTNQSISLSYSRTHRDGYRENNVLDREVFYLNSQHYLTEKHSLSLLLNYNQTKAFIPSSINEEDFINDPESAAFTWGTAMGHEDYNALLGGLTWRFETSDSSHLKTTLYLNNRQNFEPRPFNILEEESSGLGLRSVYHLRDKIFNRTYRSSIGVELYSEHLDWMTFQNLYRDFPDQEGVFKGDAISNFEEERNTINLFWNNDLHLTSKWHLNASLSLNRTNYVLNDLFNSGQPSDQSGEYSYDLQLSPSVALNYLMTPTSQIYLSAARGFSPLSLEETLLPDGNINNEIEPETAWNYEVGYRAQSRNVLFSTNIYWMDVRNLLVARRTSEDMFVGVNAGQTQHLGWESQLNWKAIDRDQYSLLLNGSLTLQDFTFEDFVDGDEDYSGNELTGVPRRQFNINLSQEFFKRFTLNFNTQHVSGFPMRDDNSVYSDAFNLLHANLQYNVKLGQQFDIFTNFSVFNVLNETYASQILINAGSFGGSAPRYYYPGEPRNYMLRVHLKYTFK